jgi:hypothetical protein
LSARVKELTKGAQTPRTTVPGERFINPRVFMVQRPPRDNSSRVTRRATSRQAGRLPPRDA